MEIQEKRLELEDILLKIKGLKPFLKEEFGIEKIAVFGSYAKNEQTEESDLDLLVHFKEGVSKTYEKQEKLENFFCNEFLIEKVDLVNEKYFDPIIRYYAKKDLIYV